MKNQSHNVKQRPFPFPVDALPADLQGLCGGHPGIAAMAALTVIAGAIGPSARIWRATTQESFSGQLFLVIQSSDGHAACLAALLAPLREFQRCLLADAGLGADADILRKKAAKIKMQREQFLSSERL